jgi:hypothetical protein
LGGKRKKEEPGSEEEERGCHASGQIGMALRRWRGLGGKGFGEE